MATIGDERFQEEAQACLASRAGHFCDCRDTDCPLNPNNPRNLERGCGCDACIRKCLALGEIPSCFFNAVGGTVEGWEDFTYAGFVSYCGVHGVTG